MEVLGAQHIWAPGVSICDGIAYEYAQQNKLLLEVHDFEQDIIASTANISKRYMCSRKRNEIMEHLALSIFDTMTSDYPYCPGPCRLPYFAIPEKYSRL